MNFNTAAFSALNYMGEQIGYEKMPVEILATPIVLGFAEDISTNYPDVQISTTLPNLLGSALDHATALKAAGMSPYSFTAAGKISFSPKFAAKLKLTDGDALLPQEILHDCVILAGRSVQQALDIGSKAIMASCDKDLAWHEGHCSTHIAVSFPVEKAAWDRAVHLFELQVRLAGKFEDWAAGVNSVEAAAEASAALAKFTQR